MKQSLSVVIITYNEEKNIRECLESVRRMADEIVIVDGNSTDQTLTIAKEYASVIKITDDWLGFGVQKNRALSLATSDWVLSLDGDERVSPELAEEISFLLKNQPSHNAYKIPRSSWFCGRFIKYSGWSPDYVLRLFNRQSAKFSNDLVHERVLFDGPVKNLRHPLIHYSFRNFSQVLDKMDRYSTASAELLYANGVKASLTKAVMHGIWAFLRTYFFRAGFLDGAHGFALAVSNAEGTYYRYIKLWFLIQERKECQRNS